MSQYNFDEIINRKGTDSIKWDHLETHFGRDDLLPLWVADMDFKSPPEVIEAMKKVADHGLYGYVLPRENYYNAVKGWMKRRFDWEIESDWISFMPGIVPAISLAINIFTEPGDGVIVQQPVYFPFMGVTKEAGRKVVNNRLLETENGYEMNFEELETLASDSKNKMLILCSPHNPVGRVWTSEELQKLVDICTENDVLIVSDEIHQDLIHEGHVHIPTAKCTNKDARIITCTAPSKTFNVASLFASNIIISNETLRKTFKAELDKMHLMPSAFTIQGVIAAYDFGEPWLKELLHYLADNIDYVDEYLKKELPRVSLVKPDATFLLWLDFRDYGLSSKELERLMKEEALVALNKGWMFGREGEGHMRLNVGCPRDVLKEALERIKEVFIKL